MSEDSIGRAADSIAVAAEKANERRHVFLVVVVLAVCFFGVIGAWVLYLVDAHTEAMYCLELGGAVQEIEPAVTRCEL